MPTVTGVINEFAHPPLGIVTRELIPGTVSGDMSLQRVRGPINVDAWGITFSYFTLPAELGRELGNPDTMLSRIVQVSSVYVLLDLSTVILDSYDGRTDGEMFWWSQPLPDHILVHVLPGCVLIGHWLVTI